MHFVPEMRKECLDKSKMILCGKRNIFAGRVIALGHLLRVFAKRHSTKYQTNQQLPSQ